jgi:hypothetical protein
MIILNKKKKTQSKTSSLNKIKQTIIKIKNKQTLIISIFKEVSLIIFKIINLKIN